MKLAEVVYWLIIIAGVIRSFVGIVAAAYSSKYDSTGFVPFIFLFYAIVVPLLSFLIAGVVRAFLKLYANISINLHEINMKIK